LPGRTLLVWRRSWIAEADVSDLQEQARALGDPTRHTIFRFIGDAAQPVGVADITAHVGLNHNAVRQHLAKLVAAGLVVESTAYTGAPGRPRLQYEVAPGTDSRWGVVGPYQRLSVLLTEIISTGDAPLVVGRRAGARLRVQPTDDPIADIAEALDRQGFDPDVRRPRRGGQITLRACPFEAAALADQETVCTLHLGIAEGLAEGTELEVEELVVKDPRRAGCRIVLRPAR
jgi:predicted ArsR family transcriptional regulator